MINVLLSLIILGSSTAFNNLVSIGVVGLFASYFVAASLLLYRRTTGGIKHFKDDADDDNPDVVDGSSSAVVNTVGAQKIWGPWRITPGILGTAVNAYACAYMVLIIFFVLWPPERPVTAENMNYGVVVVGGVVLLSTGWYFVGARGTYNGPIVEVGR
ncbi:MAG: hypothetical protein Q9227_002364 [Pyrenula ochraceoflavens]